MPDTPDRPDWTPELRARLAGVDADPARIDDIVLELEQHLEDRYDELIEDGRDPAAARAAALAELASPDVLRRALGMVERPAPRSPRVLGAPARGGWLLGLWGDVRDGVRALRTSPGLTVVALLTLAVGIGANVAIFSVVNAVLLRPLPFADPDRLVGFWGSAPQMGVPIVAWPDALYVRFRNRGRLLRPVAAYGQYQYTITNGTGDAERIRGAAVTANFFETLGRWPIRGRAFTSEEEAPRREHVAILGYGLWQRRYGGDPRIVGRTIQAAEGPATIVGVMPPGFDFPNRAEVWIPLETDPTSIDCWCYSAIGRLAPGATPEDGAREMAWLTDGFYRERDRKPAPDPKAKDPEAIVIAQPLARTLVGDVRGPLLILLCAVGTVLLIACANVANLLLARASARTREIALRACLGASPWRIARQLFVESLLLALGGSILGLALAAWSSRLLARLAAERLPHVHGVPLDPSVLLFTVAVTVLTVVLFGVGPAVRGARIDLHDVVRDGWRATRSAAGRRLADAFVVVQFALSVVLLVVAALLLRSLGELLAVDPGFRPEGVLVGRVSMPWLDMPEARNWARARAFYSQLDARLAALPGVRRAGLTSIAPFSDGEMGQIFFIKGREPGPDEPKLVASVRAVTPGYFDAVGTGLRRGRMLEAGDREGTPPVVVVDETLARRFWPDGNAVGQRLRLGDTGPWRTIVGVVGSVKHHDLAGDALRYVYVPHAQHPSLEMDLVVRTTVDPASLSSVLRREIHALDPSLPLYDVHTLDEAVERSVGTRRLTNRLLAWFSIAAIVLASLGIYGVTALSVGQRVQEFGVRLALGASRPAVLRLVLRQGLTLAIVGVAIGLAGAAWLTQYVSTLLFRVAPLDPVIFAAATLTLVAVALIACYVPARRATRTDPLVALRSP
jgi:putative ABC transport system permease protein